MGRVYCGAYAEQVGYDHEGYGARLLPGGELTATWSAETDDFVAYVAACACGWTGDRHPPTDAGEAAAVEDWDRTHLQPLVAEVVERGWTRWAGEIATAAAEVAGHVSAGRLAAAGDAMSALARSTETWTRSLERIVDDATSARGEQWS